EEEPPLHDDETHEPGVVSGGDVVDEQPRQVEEPGEPGHDEHHVKGLEPQHSPAIVANGGAFSPHASGSMAAPRLPPWPEELCPRSPANSPPRSRATSRLRSARSSNRSCPWRASGSASPRTPSSPTATTRRKSRSTISRS